MSTTHDNEPALKQLILLPRPGSPPLSRRRPLIDTATMQNELLSQKVQRQSSSHETIIFDAEEDDDDDLASDRLSVKNEDDYSSNDGDMSDGIISVHIDIKLDINSISPEIHALQEPEGPNTGEVNLSNPPFVKDCGSGAIIGSEEPSFNKGEDDFDVPPHTVNDIVFHSLLVDNFTKEIRLAKSKITNQLYAVKVFSKHALVRDSEVGFTRSEAQIHYTLRHPFIASLYSVFQDTENLYMLIEYGSRGELGDLWDVCENVTENCVQFFMAQLVLALQYLHYHKVLHRDLKLGNLVIDGDGYLKLIDFGFAEDLARCPNERASSIVGTLRYFAPEYLLEEYKTAGFSYASDWWAVGVIAYELLTGTTPFQADFEGTHRLVYFNILHRKINLPDRVSFEAKEFVLALLRRDPEKRLGAGRFGAIEVMRQSFFKDVDWDKMLAKKVTPPFVPPADPSKEIAREGYDEMARTELYQYRYAEEKPESHWDIFKDF